MRTLSRLSIPKTALAALAFTILLGCALLTLLNAPLAEAATGARYSASLSRSYKHPVTGKIEDSGGSASYATGQAMVESAVADNGLLEVASNGSVYLTMRMSLIDHIKSFDFKAQKRGTSGWSSTKGEVTKRGSDKSGTTNDVRVKVPSKNAIVRVKMFVTTMGRDVTYYVSIGSLSKGAPSGFKSLIVTSESSGGTAPSSKKNTHVSEPSDKKGDAEAGDSKDASASAGATKKSSKKSAEKASKKSGDSSEGDSKEDGAASSASDLNEGAAVNAQGLSLSTTPEGTQVESNAQTENESEGRQSSTSTAASLDPTQLVLAVAAAALGVGLVLVAVAAVIVWQFRLRWSRWGGNDPDDYSVEYRRQHHGE